MPDEPESRPALSTDARHEAHRLRQMASEMILASSSLTDELTDQEAQPLIRWGVEQAEAAADGMAGASQANADSPGRDLGEALADQVAPIRKLMARINRLVPNRHALSADQLFEEFQRLLALSVNLPRSPSLGESAESMAELAARQADLDGRAFVQALVDILGGPHRAENEVMGLEPGPGDKRG